MGRLEGAWVEGKGGHPRRLLHRLLLKEIKARKESIEI